MANAFKAEQGTLQESAELLKAHNRVLELIAQGAPLPKVLDVLLPAIEAQAPECLARSCCSIPTA